MLVEQPRQFANREAVPHRNRIHPDERFMPLHQHRPFHLRPADRIGPIAHDRLDAVPRGRLQAVRHRVDVGINAHADVLQIDHQHVHFAQHGRGRLARFAVQGVDRDAAHGVFRVPRFDHVVLHVRSKPVLGSEDGRQVRAGMPGDAVDDVAEVPVHRRRIAHQADALAGEPPGGQEAFRPECHRHRAIIPLCGSERQFCPRYTRRRSFSGGGGPKPPGSGRPGTCLRESAPIHYPPFGGQPRLLRLRREPIEPHLRVAPAP